MADRAHITQSAYRVYELGDRNPKPGILDRIAKVLCVRPEYQSSPVFRNHRELAYVLLENEDIFGYTVRDIDGAAAIATGCGSAMGFFAEFIHNWDDIRKRFDHHVITRDEHED